MSINMYAAACSENGGIYHYTLNENGSLNFKEKINIDRPMYMCIENGKMYVVLRKPFENDNSGILAYDILNDGSLKRSDDKIYDTKGVVACHVSCAGEKVFYANYISGSVGMIGGKHIVHEGKTGPNKLRQEAPHAHQMYLTPDKKYVIALDLGLDAAIVYDLDLNKINSIQIPAGHGARHCVMTRDLKKLFIIGEMSSCVSVFEFNKSNGNAKYIKTYDTFDESYEGKRSAAAIKLSPDERFLYVSDRGDNTVSCFEICGFELKNLKKISSMGKSPRDFEISPDGNFMAVTNELTDNIHIFGIDKSSGKLTDTGFDYTAKNPLCVIYY